MKLYISNSGLMEPVKYFIKDARNDLRQAAYSAPNSPSGFQYASYVNNLDNEIQGYITELNNIERAIEKSERRYSELFSDKKEELIQSQKLK